MNKDRHGPDGDQELIVNYDQLTKVMRTLALEAGDVLRLDPGSSPHHLEGDRPLELGVVCSPDRPHGAAAELGEEDVAAEAAPGPRVAGAERLGLDWRCGRRDGRERTRLGRRAGGLGSAKDGIGGRLRHRERE